MLKTNKQQFGCDDYGLPVMEMTFLFFSPNNIRRQLCDGLVRKKTHTKSFTSIINQRQNSKVLIFH